MMAVCFQGKPILVEFRPLLRASRGKLVSGTAAGNAVHAASFLRDRRIVLDRALLRDARERDRILAHEIFHFVWWKLTPLRRREYELLIRAEWAAGVVGEMGWSAEWRKQALYKAGLPLHPQQFRDYLCESFCDSAAAFTIRLRRHPEITLPAPARSARAQWLQIWMKASLAGGGLKI